MAETAEILWSHWVGFGLLRFHFAVSIRWAATGGFGLLSESPTPIWFERRELGNGGNGKRQRCPHNSRLAGVHTVNKASSGAGLSKYRMIDWYPKRPLQGLPVLERHIERCAGSRADTADEVGVVNVDPFVVGDLTYDGAGEPQLAIHDRQKGKKTDPVPELVFPEGLGESLPELVTLLFGHRAACSAMWSATMPSTTRTFLRSSQSSSVRTRASMSTQTSFRPATASMREIS